MLASEQPHNISNKNVTLYLLELIEHQMLRDEN